MSDRSRGTLPGKFTNIKSRLRSLRLRVIVLLILALLPAFAIMIFTASESRNRVIKDTQENAIRLTRLAASNQVHLIDASRDILITLSQLPAIQSQDRPACLFFLSNLLMQYPLYANFGAANGTGEVYCMTLPQRQPFNIRNETYFQHALNNIEFAVSEYHISTINSQPMITLAYPVLSATGEKQGIVFASLDLRWLGSYLNSAALPEDTTLRVIDNTGLILASYPKGDFEIGRHVPYDTLTQEILAEKNGLKQVVDENGKERLYAFTPLQAGGDSDIYMIISIPTEAAFAESNRILVRNLLALLLGAILALITAWFGTELFFLRQVNRLVEATQRLSTGDLSARTNWTYGQGELDKLAMGFDEMADTLQQRELEQKKSQVQIRHQKERAETLASITERLNTTLDLDSVLQAVCDETCLAVNAPAACVTVFQQSKEDISRVGGPGKDDILRSNIYPLDFSRVKKYATTMDEHYLTVDLEKNAHQFPQEANGSFIFKFLICINLIHEGKLIGRLDLFLKENIPIAGDELTFLKGIANSSVMAISNAQLFTALKIEERVRGDLLHRVIGAQEDERMRISRELHDETSQSLTALLLGLDTIGIASNSDIDRIGTHIKSLKKITTDMLDNIHRLIADLRPSLLDDLGLVAAIEWYGEQRVKQQGLKFRLDVNLLDERFPRPVETVLFRIVQEGLTNALRHASASSICIYLAQDEDLVKLEIHDDGIGFDPQKLEEMDPEGRGFGLMGMRERAAILGGILQVESAIGKGTTVRILFHNLGNDKKAYDSNPVS